MLKSYEINILKIMMSLYLIGIYDEYYSFLIKDSP